MSKIYVGNLAWATNNQTLRETFSAFGDVTDAIVMQDRETGRSRGFGFVTYLSQDQAEAAISSMNEQMLDGRTIKVNMANQRPQGGAGGGGGYSGGGGGGYGGQSGGYSGGGGYRGGQGGYGGGQGGYGGGQGGYGGGQGGYGNEQGGYGGGGYSGGGGY